MTAIVYPAPTEPVSVAPTTDAAIIKTARPRQWVKNAPIVAALIAAGKVGSPSAIYTTVLAIVAFCLAASAGYYVNDSVDVRKDRLHPTKCRRPIAAGLLSPTFGIGMAIALAIAAIGVTTLAHRWQLTLCLVSYLALTASYSYRLKHIPVMDMATVAAGFLLRAITGAVAIGVTISNWFFLVALFGSLLVVAGKRVDEALSDHDSTATRAVLAHYPENFLNLMVGTSAGAVILTYCLMMTERAATLSGSGVWFEVSILPFVLIIFTYCLQVFTGRGGEPSELALKDRQLQVLGLIWLLTFAIGANW
jgi:decaprenyl-phosphate phosphoribosyltransferase